MRTEETVKISHKGQITLPPSIRAALHGDTIRLVAEDAVVKLESLPQLAGSLKGYAQEYISLDTVREQIWGKAANETNTCA